MKKSLLEAKLLKAVLVIAGLVFAGEIFAQTTISSGSTVNSSSLGGNAAVTINAGGTLNMNSSPTIGTLTTANSGTSTITGTGTLTLTSGSNITVAAGNTLSIAAGVVITTPAGLVTPNLSTQTSTVSGSGSITVATITINGASSVPATLSIGSGLTVQTGAINGGNGNAATTYNLIVGGILKISGAVETGTQGVEGFTCNTGSTVEYNGSSNQTVFPTTYRNLIISGSGGTKSAPTSSLNIQGNLTIASATFSAGSSTHNLQGNWVKNGGTFTPGTGTINFNGATADTIGGSQATTFGNISFANSSASGITLNGTTTITGNATFTSGVVNAGNFTHNVQGNWEKNGGTFTPGTGTINFNGAALQTIGGTQATNFGNISFANSSASGITLSGTTTITGNATFTSGVVNAGNFTHNVQGNWINNGGTFTPGTGTINFNGATADTIGGSQATTFGNISFANSSASGITLNGTTTITGNATFTSGVVNAGNFTHNVQGNWVKNGGTFTPGTGTINFNGAALQTIGGTQATNFGNISFANTNGGISLTQPATITGNAIFTNGVVNSNATNVLIFNDNATSSLLATNAATTSYVNGPVKKIGNDAFIFPIGAATGFVPLGISAPNNTADAYTAQYFRGIPVDSANITAAGIHHISACDYWDLALTTEGGTAAAIDATFYWNANNPCTGAADNYITDPLQVRAVHYTGGSWSAASTGFGQGTAASGSVIFGGLTTFSPFTTASDSSEVNPLPVVFADTRAFEKNNGVQIEWSNLTEKDVAAYTVERSANGIDFFAISRQLPTSNQNDKASYSAFDATPSPGTNYYRIKAEETTGKIVYSNILSVNLGDAATTRGLLLYPNPVTGYQVTISLSDTRSGQYNLRVVNTAGQEVYKQIISTQGSAITQTLYLPSFVKPGVYMMIVTGDDYRESKTFIVQ